MDHFLYRDGRLYAEDVAIQDIAAQVGTPFYVYSTATLIRHFKLFDEALDGLDHLVCFAMKASSNQAILKTLGDLGAGLVEFFCQFLERCIHGLSFKRLGAP